MSPSVASDPVASIAAALGRGGCVFMAHPVLPGSYVCSSLKFLYSSALFQRRRPSLAFPLGVCVVFTCLNSGPSA